MKLTDEQRSELMRDVRYYAIAWGDGDDKEQAKAWLFELVDRLMTEAYEAGKGERP